MIDGILGKAKTGLINQHNPVKDHGSPFVDDKLLRKLYIDRIYDTYIDEEQLQACDKTIKIT